MNKLPLSLMRVCLCLGFCITPNLSVAFETEFTGFANFGITYADSEQLKFRNSLINTAREGFSWQTDTVVGLQMNTRFSNKVDFVGQVILQDRNDYAASNVLELAFLRYQINRNWSSKIGRFSTNSYMLTDYRYVRHAQYWVRPPLEMYSPTGVLGNMNGVQLTYSNDYSIGMLKVGWSYGNSYFRNDLPDGKLRNKFDQLNGFSVELNTNRWRLQANYLSAFLVDFEVPGKQEILSLEQTLPPMLRPIGLSIRGRIISEDSKVTYATIGAHYQGDSVEFITEVADFSSDWALSQSGRTAYASLAYHFGDITPFIIVSSALRDEYPEIVDYAQLAATLSPEVYQQVVLSSDESNELLRGASIDQDSVSVGMRWDVTMDWTLKFQLDHNRISDAGSGLFSIVDDMRTPSQELKYNVINLSLSTVF